MELTYKNVDKDIINWFKANGPSYQTRINQVLRTYMEWRNPLTTSRIAEARAKYSAKKVKSAKSFK